MFPNGQFGCMSQISDSRTLERVPFCLLYVLLVLQPEAHRYQNRIVHPNYVFLVYIECHPVTGFLVKKLEEHKQIRFSWLPRVSIRKFQNVAIPLKEQFPAPKCCKLQGKRTEQQIKNTGKT